MKIIYNILLLGTGGQGIITLSKILATAAMSRNLKVIVTQKKGLAQRGGSVVAQVRIGDVYSPQIPKYSSHSLILMDINETFGYLDYINKNSILLVNNKGINDSVLSSKKNKKQQKEIKQLQELMNDNIVFIDTKLIIKQKDVSRGANIYMLGALFGMDNRINSFIKKDDIISSVKKNLKKNAELNIELFNEGINFIQDKQINYN